MEKKKFSYWYIIIGLIIIILIISSIKNLNYHNQKEIEVVNRKILESAEKYYLKERNFDKITLKLLYDNGYLDKQINPITKELIDENTCIMYVNDKAIFC